jgi:hypothetical protein
MISCCIRKLVIDRAPGENPDAGGSHAPTWAAKRVLYEEKVAWSPAVQKHTLLRYFRILVPRFQLAVLRLADHPTEIEIFKKNESDVWLFQGLRSFQKGRFVQQRAKGAWHYPFGRNRHRILRFENMHSFLECHLSNGF